jgi:hypothetical protein
LNMNVLNIDIDLYIYKCAVYMCMHT